MKPKILVTRPASGSLFPWLCIKSGVLLAGGIPCKVTPKDEDQFLEFDGIILSGGSDINPKRYHQKNLSNAVFDDDRDEMELALLHRAIKENKPILGICRGMELLNIYFQGNLYQDLNQIFDDFLPTSTTLGKIIARHQIEVKAPSILYRILKSQRCKVNSLHHQGVAEVGEGLFASAQLKNGIVQAIEHTGENWILGVQWHPEYMLHLSKQRRIFKTFVDVCRPTDS